MELLSVLLKNFGIVLYDDVENHAQIVCVIWNVIASILTGTDCELNAKNEISPN